MAANASTGAYAWVNLNDANLAVISAFNAACCLAVLVLATYKRVSLAKPAALPPHPPPGARSRPDHDAA